MKYAKTLKENLQLIKESWMPDSETISWLKDYLRDVKRGEGYVDIDKVVYDADIELNKDFSKNKKDLADYIKRIGGGSILKEGTIYTVIRTKNGKVDYIEKVEQLDNGTYMKKAGTSFDRAFIGMDPQEAKNALVKYSHFDPKLIMIDEGCKKVQEGFDVKDGGNGKVYHTAETQSDAEAWAKDNVNKLHRPLKVVSGYKMFKSFEPRTIVKEATSNLREGFGELEVYTSFGPGIGVQIYPSRNGELTAHVGYVGSSSGNSTLKKELKTETELKAIDEIKIADLKQIEKVVKKHLDALDSDLQRLFKQYGYK